VEIETGTHEVPATPPAVVSSDTPHELWKEDLIAALLSATLVIGLFVDGWNHLILLHGRLGSFWTPWHGLLYAGFALAAAWVLTRNRHLYQKGRTTKPELYRLFGIPLRYPFAVAGLALATVGLGGDLVWHTVFGQETGVARVIAPFHLMLFAGGAALAAGAFRSAWHAPRHYPAVIGFKQFLPPLISLTLLAALGCFMFQWLSPFVDWQPSVNFGAQQQLAKSLLTVEGTVEIASVARVFAMNLLLLGPVVLAMRRWRLPFGSVTFMFTTVAVGMTALTNFHLGAAIPAAVLGGLTADVLILWLDPSPSKPIAYRVVAGVTPLVMWTAYFVLVDAAYGIRWPFDLWLGAVGLASVSGLALSFVAVPPSVPVGAWPAEPATEAGGAREAHVEP
jgi:hypothetical protein